MAAGQLHPEEAQSRLQVPILSQKAYQVTLPVALRFAEARGLWPGTTSRAYWVVAPLPLARAVPHEKDLPPNFGICCERAVFSGCFYYIFPTSKK